jgi:hypothetical protein
MLLARTLHLLRHSVTCLMPMLSRLRRSRGGPVCAEPVVSDVRNPVPLIGVAHAILAETLLKLAGPSGLEGFRPHLLRVGVASKSCSRQWVRGPVPTARAVPCPAP